MQWDETLSNIAKKVADKWGVPTDQAKLVIETYVSCNMKAMRQFQPVIWANLGKFWLDQNRTLKTMLRMYKKYREGIIDKESLKEKITRWWPYHTAARWHKPHNGRRYRFERVLEEMVKNGIVWKPAKWSKEDMLRRKQFKNERQISRNTPDT